MGIQTKSKKFIKEQFLCGFVFAHSLCARFFVVIFAYSDAVLEIAQKLLLMNLRIRWPKIFKAGILMDIAKKKIDQ